MRSRQTSRAWDALDAVAIKPSESPVSAAARIPVGTVAVDYEGCEHLPDREALADLARETRVLVTTPVRADGFDPLGDDSLLAELPPAAGRVLVAGHPAYLTDEERERAIAPRLGAALETAPDAWVGTEGIERTALATGAPQYELLSRTTEEDLRALRAAGFDGEIAVYAPTLATDDADEILDALGAYVARRRPVADALPAGAPTDSAASGRARSVLLSAARDYALVGSGAGIEQRARALRSAGATTVVGYPAGGLRTVD
ncbi:luciferase [Saliphagus sp. LR7]|uniref:DUF7388 family protein n=1 Tax=Saliphagus sp. LR7 TaxID=2282654 RepID=UPI000DF751FB|nr:luciferase [Saliphagus sp. LR7]